MISLIEGIGVVMVATYSMLILTYWFAWVRMPYYSIISAEATMDNEFPISIIIPARNESEHIISCLQSIQSQDFNLQKVEIIVIDDHSTDTTAQLVHDFLQREKEMNIKLIRLEERPETKSYKKHAITTAVREALGELIITTDADCVFEKKWLKTITNCYITKQPKLISSPVAFYQEQNWFQKAQTLEFLGLIAVGAAAIGLRRPNMCNGANMAYSKEAFLAVKGYEGNEDIVSGDDSFLLAKIHQAYPAAICFLKSRDAIAYTRAKTSLLSFISQRKRWASKNSKQGNSESTRIALLVFLTNLWVCMACIVGWYSTSGLIGILLLIKLCIDFIFLLNACVFFKRTELLWIFIPEQLIYSIYVIVIAIISPFGSYEWKERKVNNR